MRHLACLFIVLGLSACGTVKHGQATASQKGQPSADLGRSVDIVTPVLVDDQGTCQWSSFASPYDNIYTAQLEGFDVFTCSQYQPSCQVFKDNQTGLVSTSCPEVPSQAYEVPSEI